MERKEFLKKGILGTGILTASAAGLSALANNIDEIKTLKPVQNIDLLDLITFQTQTQKL